jgi:mono/diheme cytochrome c family protein
MKCRKVKSWINSLGAIVISCLLFSPRPVSADPSLIVDIGDQARHFGRDELLRRPDVARVTVANDISYGKAMTYLAVPLAALLTGLDPLQNAVIESIAIDGFAAHLPLALVTNTDPNKAIAWLAIEPDSPPWPVLPGKTQSAGPFYIVWTGASVASVRSEQWPFQVKRLESQTPPVDRWPTLNVDSGLPSADPARLGKALFVKQCLPCHTLDGAGSGTMGPDLNQPMNPTKYMTRGGLHALIRDPRSVRSWSTMQMPSFALDQISDEEISSIISYLEHVAARQKTAN